MESISDMSGNTSQKIRQISVKKPDPKQTSMKPKFHLLNIRQKWFISPLGNCAVNLDAIGDFAATDEQFLTFVQQFVRLKPEHLAKTWGTIARCEILNWITKHGKPERQPKFYESKRAAEISIQPSEISEKFGSEKQTEISNSTETGNTPPDSAA